MNIKSFSPLTIANARQWTDHDPLKNFCFDPLRSEFNHPLPNTLEQALNKNDSEFLDAFPAHSKRYREIERDSVKVLLHDVRPSIWVILSKADDLDHETLGVSVLIFVILFARRWSNRISRDLRTECPKYLTERGHLIFDCNPQSTL